jgi:hypothetical protein
MALSSAIVPKTRDRVMGIDLKTIWEVIEELEAEEKQEVEEVVAQKES